MFSKIIYGRRSDFEEVINHLKTEAGKIRTGRANPEAFETLLVSYYGSKAPLKQMASVTVPEARLVVIQPWDTDNLTNIEAAIKLSGMDANPNNDGKVIRISIPPLTEERRKEMVKVLNQKAEDARISVRTIREEIWQAICKAEKAGEIGEDDKFAGKERLQELVDEFNKNIEEVREKKEGEIMTV